MKPSKDQVAVAKALTGKTIARIELNPFDPRDPAIGRCKDPAHDPTIFFTDGSRLRLLVDETEVGEYGVNLALYGDE